MSESRYESHVPLVFRTLLVGATYELSEQRVTVLGVCNDEGSSVSLRVPSIAGHAPIELGLGSVFSAGSHIWRVAHVVHSASEPSHGSVHLEALAPLQ
jgi:hypothetical protein